MKHLFRQGKNSTAPTFLLLHGTGGNESDLLPIAEHIDNTASILSVRGEVLEHGMPRFFKRLAEGVFDEEDLLFRTTQLNQFLDEAAEMYKFDRFNIIAIGYSNGANIAASLLFHYEYALRAAILHHPMVPRRGIELPDLSDKLTFITAGTNDPLCPPSETLELQSLLEQANAGVDLFWHTKGHRLIQEEVNAAKVWYEKKISGN